MVAACVFVVSPITVSAQPPQDRNGFDAGFNASTSFTDGESVYDQNETKAIRYALWEQPEAYDGRVNSDEDELRPMVVAGVLPAIHAAEDDTAHIQDAKALERELEHRTVGARRAHDRGSPNRVVARVTHFGRPVRSCAR